MRDSWTKFALSTAPEGRFHRTAGEAQERFTVSIASDARVIVTGDRAMLARGEFRSIRIVSLSAYLD